MLNVKEVNTRPANVTLIIKSKTEEGSELAIGQGVMTADKLKALEALLEDFDSNGVDFELEVRR